MCRSPHAVSCVSTLVLMIMVVQAEGAYAAPAGPARLGKPVVVALSPGVLQAFVVGSIAFIAIIVLAFAVLYHTAKGHWEKQTDREKQSP